MTKKQNKTKQNKTKFNKNKTNKTKQTMSGEGLDDETLNKFLFHVRNSYGMSSSIPFEKHIAVNEGITLVCHYLKCKEAPSEYLIVHFHGNGELTEDYLDDPLVEFLTEKLAVNVLLFEYRQYGKSNGKALMGSMLQDMIPLEKYIIEQLNFKPDKVILFGRSMGSQFALHYTFVAKEYAALILDCPIASLKTFAPFAKPKAKEEMDAKMDNLKKIAKVSKPLLLLHAIQDDIVPLNNSIKLYDASSSPHKKLAKFPGGHNDFFPLNENKYLEELEQFILAVKSQ